MKGDITMKEITLTSTIVLPDNNEIKGAVKATSPIEPRQAVMISFFIGGKEETNNPDEIAVYECLKAADNDFKNRIASDLIAAYCDAHNIKWRSINGGMIQILHYGHHFVIETPVEI